jgi:hypothetical protein
MFDILPIRLKALCLVKNTECGCELPRAFIDKILQIDALELSLTCKDYHQAALYWKKLCN